MKSFEYFWKLLNSPLIIIIIALSAWPLLASFTIHNSVKRITTDSVNAIVDAFDSFDQHKDEKALFFLQSRDNIKFTNIKKAYSDWPSKEKFIATITNNHDKTIRDLNLNISFYNKNNELIDVVDSMWISGLIALKPKESFNFDFSRDIGDAKDKDLEDKKSTKVIIKVSSFDEFKKT